MEKGLEFPRFMCRMPGPEQLESGKFETRIVATADEAQGLLDAGWHFDQYSAKDAYVAAHSDHAGSAKSGKPTREELEQKATELGIEFKPSTSDKKLGDAIASKLADAAVK